MAKGIEILKFNKHLQYKSHIWFLDTLIDIICTEMIIKQSCNFDCLHSLLIYLVINSKAFILILMDNKKLSEDPSTKELNQFVQTMLKQMQERFDNMSSNIIGRVD